MGERNSNRKCNQYLIGSIKEGMIGTESVKNISKGFSREYVCRIGHIEVGGHC